MFNWYFFFIIKINLFLDEVLTIKIENINNLDSRFSNYLQKFFGLEGLSNINSHKN